uniref:Uncharacterized protein n=1 Tax=Mycena chlorophos TaxID=658473 RepID=A0ABQ0LGH1_MYCCL|nr:predicted protein [Mycena chlorophos]
MSKRAAINRLGGSYAKLRRSEDGESAAARTQNAERGDEQKANDSGNAGTHVGPPIPRAASAEETPQCFSIKSSTAIRLPDDATSNNPASALRKDHRARINQSAGPRPSQRPPPTLRCRTGCTATARASSSPTENASPGRSVGYARVDS